MIRISVMIKFPIKSSELRGADKLNWQLYQRKGRFSGCPGMLVVFPLSLGDNVYAKKSGKTRWQV